MITETFIKGSDNAISLTLLEDNEAISVSWTSLSIYIGDPALVTITRTVAENGVTFSAGVLGIKPGLLTENLSALVPGESYPVWIKIVDASNYPDGVDFGAADSDEIEFLIQERP